MDPCTAHPETIATATCSACAKAGEGRCIAYDIDGSAACASCARAADERGHALGSALVVFVAVGFLATLALGYILFRGRPFIGGFAAVIAAGLGRVLQAYVPSPVVTRRPGASRSG